MKTISQGVVDAPVSGAFGVTIRGDGIDVAIPAPHAEAVAVCLFDADGRENRRVRLPDPDGAVFRGHIPGVPPGTRYGLRVYGPWAPEHGHRFNPSKLLLDPWALEIDRPFRLHPLLFDGSRPLPDDTAGLMPKGIVTAPAVAAATDRPAFRWDNQVIYELHVRGVSMNHPEVPPAICGTYAALGHPALTRHLTRLGVTTVEIMPSAAWLDERHLPPLGLSDYWGYNPVGFLAPDPRLAPGGWAEVRGAVDALHQAGLSVVLDVVLNHSGESDQLGPTLSLRGVDNALFYRLLPEDPSRYVDDSGCGNILAMDRPSVLRLGLDALRAWALYGGFDGFRLDLASTLARRSNGFDPAAPFLLAVEQDPVLAGRVMIAEPWDIGAGGYQLGGFPDRWGEWNDRYRDTMRRFWRGDSGMAGAFATRFSGSADIFGARRRPVTRSVNFVTAHDGFTLADLVAYAEKHNAANGEDNRDGTTENLSWNNGVEGPTDDPAIRAARSRDVRALLATLLLSRGTPMLSMGDEAGRSQNGNNNAYAQDNATAWYDWSTVDESLIAFTERLVATRRQLAPLFDGATLTGTAAEGSTLPDIAWLRPDGQPLGPDDWSRDTNRTVIAALFKDPLRAVLVFHAGTEAFDVALPVPRADHHWVRLFDTADPASAALSIAPRSVTVFMEEAGEAGESAGTAVEAAGAASGQPKPTGVPDALLNQLAEAASISTSWWDVMGNLHQVSAETKRALLTAMRMPAGTAQDCRDSLARLQQQSNGVLPPVITVRDGEPILIEPRGKAPAWLTLLREDGSLQRFHLHDGRTTVPPQPLGRHRLLQEDRDAPVCHLTVAPPACYIPPELQDGGRRWGIATHLYALRRKGEQGIGDFTTLARFAEDAAGHGAAVLGLNPLHVLFPHDRNRISPYQPSDRRFLDPFYIDVAQLPGGAAYDLPFNPAVDYNAMWAHKAKVLRAAFEAMPMATGEPEHDALWRLAVFQTITAELGTASWQDWPNRLRHPANPDVATFAAEHPDQVRFYLYLQQLADEQLAAAAKAGREAGLTLGFYRDLAVGAAPDGAEAWANQDILMQNCSVGSPPDLFATKGQIWSLPPPDPAAMRREGYAGFTELVIANMRHAGALRIDHVLGLQRLFVVPDGAIAAEGSYVNYPRDDLLAQLALQSHRARCLVVGEDLGTVPDGLTDALSAAKVLSYSVLWFEWAGKAIRPSSEWRPLAAACISTHDLPTLAGWWVAADIKEREALGMMDAETADKARAQRTGEKTLLIDLLRRDGELTEAVDIEQPMSVSLAAAIHAFVCATPALLALVQTDDLAGELDAVNLPNTNTERANWQRRNDADISEICRTPLAAAILAAMRPRNRSSGGGTVD